MSYLRPGWFAAVLISAIPPAFAQIVPLVQRGDVSVVDAAGTHPLLAGETIKSGSIRLSLAKDALVQLRCQDNSLMTLASDSEVSVDESKSRITLWKGSLSVLPANGRTWRVDAGTESVLATGMLRLVRCAEGCNSPPGLYGKISTGDAIVEYKGGRSVFRTKAFRALADGSRPEALVVEPSFMLDNSQLEYARNAKESVAVLIRTGIEHFEGGRHAAARDVLLQARQLAPAEAIILYFLGLNALDQRQDDEALNFLKRYSQEDPAGARERKLGDVLALLTSSELRKEAKRAVDNEEALSSQPPEPNSIAVQPFVNQGDPTFAPLAKGIASMLIADLSKVPGLRVLEREKVQRIIDEAHLSESTLVDNKSAVRTGRIIRAEKVVVGKFGVQ